MDNFCWYTMTVLQQTWSAILVKIYELSLLVLILMYSRPGQLLYFLKPSLLEFIYNCPCSYTVHVQYLVAVYIAGAVLVEVNMYCVPNSKNIYTTQKR